jgi:signal peptidase I
MASVVTSRRIPWIALALSFLSAGVGHLYCGRIAKGLVLYFAWFLIPLCVTIAALGAPSTASLLLLVLLPIIVVVIVYWYAAIDAWRTAFQIGSEYTLRDYNRAIVYWLLIIVQLICSVTIVAGVRGLVFEAFLVPSGSMAPTILNGDRILARKLLRSHHFPERGDLVVFRNPEPTGGSTFIKRVVAVAGDRVALNGDRVLINGTELERHRVPAESVTSLGEQVRGQVSFEVNSARRYLVAYGSSSDGGAIQDGVEVTVPPRHVFVLGDHRDRSRDSRHFGSIHIGDVIGYVDYIYWPAASWSRFGVANDRLP